MKTWIKTNLSKITLALALTGATTGTIGLIMGGVLTHENTKLNKYLERNHQWVLGDATIWEHKRNDKYKIDLYFSIKPNKQEDIKWDGTYPDGYFY